MESKKYLDLHLHLDGSINLEIAKHLAKNYQNKKVHPEIVKLFETKNDNELENLLSVSRSCQSLEDYLACFSLPISLLQTEENICDAVCLLLENLDANNVIYSEIRFAPQYFCNDGLSQEDVTKAALLGLKQSQGKLINANLILCCMRGNDNEKENFETLKLAQKLIVKNAGVTAIDLAGAEALFPTKNYKKLFNAANNFCIPFTIHAGEADGKDSIISAIQFGAKRIGHGIKAAYDNELLELISQKNIALELCPSSNLQTKAIENITQFPVNIFLENNIKATINTDNMAISRTNIIKEFELLHKYANLSLLEEDVLINNAIDVAFCDAETKNYLQKTVNASKFTHDKVI